MTRILAAIAAATLIAAPAFATDQQRTATVRYGDLDLAGAAGKRILARRIARATEKVCGSYALASNTDAWAIDKCRARVAAQIASRGATPIAAR